MHDGSTNRLSEVYRRYVARLHGLAERLISDRLKRQYSAEDAAHSALASFYHGIHDGRFHAQESGNLWNLLTTILHHKVQKKGKHLREELILADSHDPRPSHEDAVELADAIETALADLKPRHVEICRMHYQKGLGVGETASVTGCSRWTVRRVLQRFTEQLKEHIEHGNCR
ncbi:MAG: sigma-70 family RNA polymerase sigma factor [Planctomycetaceae bacterium]|nr:MAG: sigma-70 family RNA polymerase sigma factor [Planctomycetaceae bacterium]